MKTAAEYISLSFGNEALLKRNSYCSCYNCLRAFKTDSVVDYATERNGNRTGFCPHCWVDALLPGVVEQEELSYANSICFGRK